MSPARLILLPGLGATGDVFAPQVAAFPDAVIPETAAMIQGFPFDSKSSMLEALERGQRLELPWLSGAVSRLGRESGVPTPAHTFITTVLTPFVQPG